MSKNFNSLIRNTRDIPWQQMIQRYFDFTVAPPYTTKTAGATLIPLHNRLVLNTVTAGANKICEFYEFVKNGVFSRLGEGAFFRTYHYLEAFISEGTPTNPAGEAFMGIEIGSQKLAPPLNDHPSTQLSSIQLRFNQTTGLLETSVYSDLTGINSPVVESFDGSDTGAFAIEYDPLRYIRFFQDNELVHIINDQTLLRGLYNNVVDDAGFGAFVTSGSDAAGAMSVSIQMMRGYSIL
jgi:hypothetical protein